ncbi:peptidase M23 [Fictibacillus macauensis ZFHKF-1]|uniref:Peptidase M23 n=1 Tax=Fictibacillus macauensis ZFHKF-1 TaxID=1196324 RepID=I8J5U0_9BACL|nr:M23 family metallopeptidase [Fictibacillus macauensis]EIT87171.1 peptidase M23 [Fictibacillus macauensis ZFHKF-1]
MLKKCIVMILLLGSLCAQHPHRSLAQQRTYSPTDVQRLALYKKMETVTSIPWYYYAGVDQYERSIRLTSREKGKPTGVIGIYFSGLQWVGPLNPVLTDRNPQSIMLFGGVGLDGNNDGIANPDDDEDLLYSFAKKLMPYGFDKENVAIGLWNYYKRDKAVSMIMQNASVYKTYGTVALHDHSFVVPLHANYSYRDTWGARRGYGGRRIHEGTDIFADYGVPVKAASYGVVETKGWNRFGGWRIGIRDINNIYHYYAHLSSFHKDIQKGDIVKPGTIVGYVGSSGYGPPGTSGKFPPHLHYGMYRDNGYTEWAFDPYPSLKVWERQERLKK